LSENEVEDPVKVFFVQIAERSGIFPGPFQNRIFFFDFRLRHTRGLQPNNAKDLGKSQTEGYQVNAIRVWMMVSGSTFRTID
jgi:hypothetical protein